MVLGKHLGFSRFIMKKSYFLLPLAFVCYLSLIASASAITVTKAQEFNLPAVRTTPGECTYLLNSAEYLCAIYTASGSNDLANCRLVIFVDWNPSRDPASESGSCKITCKYQCPEEAAVEYQLGDY